MGTHWSRCPPSPFARCALARRRHSRAKVGCSGDIPYARCCLMNLSCRPRGKAGAPIPEAVAAALAAGSIVNAVVASADVQACMELRLQVFHEVRRSNRGWRYPNSNARDHAGPHLPPELTFTSSKINHTQLHAEGRIIRQRAVEQM